MLTWEAVLIALDKRRQAATDIYLLLTQLTTQATPECCQRPTYFFS